MTFEVIRALSFHRVMNSSIFSSYEIYLLMKAFRGGGLFEG